MSLAEEKNHSEISLKSLCKCSFWLQWSPLYLATSWQVKENVPAAADVPEFMCATTTSNYQRRQRLFSNFERKYFCVCSMMMCICKCQWVRVSIAVFLGSALSFNNFNLTLSRQKNTTYIHGMYYMPNPPCTAPLPLLLCRLWQDAIAKAYYALENKKSNNSFRFGIWGYTAAADRIEI